MRRLRVAPLDHLTPGQRAYLTTGVYRAEGFTYWGWVQHGVAETWAVVRDEWLAGWIEAHPGTRPWAWWQYTAPQEPVNCKQFNPKDRAAQRRRLGGIGDPCHKALNYAPEFAFGLPTRWVSASDELYYNGCAKDIHGDPIGTVYSPGHFPFYAPRAVDPPRFESQAAYLRRQDLLAHGELERLAPDAFEPEAIRV
jgi:hypothetical protein